MTSLGSILLISSSIFFISCGHHHDVRPGTRGVHKVKVVGSDPKECSRAAIEQAQHFCEQRNRDVAFLSEKKKYIGDMNEKKYRKAKRYSKAARYAGGTTWILAGNSSLSTLGGLAAIGGVAADKATGEGYSVLMRFKCI